MYAISSNSILLIYRSLHGPSSQAWQESYQWLSHVSGMSNVDMHMILFLITSCAKLTLFLVRPSVSGKNNGCCSFMIKILYLLYAIDHESGMLVFYVYFIYNYFIRFDGLIISSQLHFFKV